METYYDTTEGSFPNQPDKWYFLAKQGKWLCTRDNQWFLKQFKILGPRSFKAAYGNATKEEFQKSVYLESAKESFGEREVRWDLNLQQDFTNPLKKSLEQDLEQIGIVPYAKFQNEITRYALNNDFNLTIERFDFGYALGKLSTTIREPTPKKYEKVAKEIMNIVFKLNIDVIAGKQEGIVNFLGRERVTHYNDLRKLGAIEIPTLEERLDYGKRIRAMQKVKHIKFFKTNVEEDINDTSNEDILNMSDEDLKDKLGEDIYSAIRQEINDEWKDENNDQLSRKLNDILTNERPIEEVERAIENLDNHNLRQPHQRELEDHEEEIDDDDLNEREILEGKKAEKLTKWYSVKSKKIKKREEALVKDYEKILAPATVDPDEDPQEKVDAEQSEEKNVEEVVKEEELKK